MWQIFTEIKKNKYVKCENGHKFCFECLRPWHGKDSCEKSLEKDFMNWKKNKNLKQCPRCKIYTEKNEGKKKKNWAMKTNITYPFNIKYLNTIF